jgi:hypothetical protein
MGILLVFEFILGHFEKLETQAKAGVLMSILAPKALLHLPGIKPPTITTKLMNQLLRWRQLCFTPGGSSSTLRTNRLPRRSYAH